jgi:hypothetical protein
MDDNEKIYCRMLGHDVTFSYCRNTTSSQPCRKIFDCWFERFDIDKFMRENYSEQQIKEILEPPMPKMVFLAELIKKSQEK